MAKVSAVEKNKKRKRMVECLSKRRVKLKSLVMCKDVSFEEKIRAMITLSELPRNSAAVRVRNRCNVTGRPRAYYRKFGISRIALRELGSQGLIPGLVKSSW